MLQIKNLFAKDKVLFITDLSPHQDRHQPIHLFLSAVA